MNIIHMRYDEYSQIYFFVAPRKNVQLEDIFDLRMVTHIGMTLETKNIF